MSTQEMQALVNAFGQHMRREEYAGTNSRGGLVSRHRWAVHDREGKRICQGANPLECFKRWQKIKDP